MSTEHDDLVRRRFTEQEFQTMLAEGIMSPDEGAIWDEGFVLVPLAPSVSLWPNPNPGPVNDATDPSDVVLAEPLTRPGRVELPDRPRILEEASENTDTLVQKSQEERTRRKFTVDEYYRMADVGILSQDERTELLNGEIILMAPIGSKHASCVNGFTKASAPLALNDRVELSVQNPVFLGVGAEVQPDIMLMRPDPYADAHPRPEDVLLLIEVSDTTIGKDRNEKMPLYARLDIPEAWLADVNEKAVFIHTEPRNGVYTNVRRVDIDGTLSPTAFPDVVIAVRDVFRW